MRRFARARGRISEAGGHQAHLSALAYITDSYFIGTVARVQNIPRFSSPAELRRALQALKNPSDLDDEDIARAIKELKEEEAADLRRRLEGALSQATNQPKEDRKEVGMMVSLDHSIYFHNPWAFRADEWMLMEMESPWAGEGRGLAIQKIWSRDGTLIATCTQEVRLRFHSLSRTLRFGLLPARKRPLTLVRVFLGSGAIKTGRACSCEDLAVTGLDLFPFLFFFFSLFAIYYILIDSTDTLASFASVYSCRLCYPSNYWGSRQ